MLKKLKICCGCGKNDVIVPEHNKVAASPTISEKSEKPYVNAEEVGQFNDPMQDISYETMNPAYMSAQTAPPLGENPYKNSEADSGMSEPLNV